MSRVVHFEIHASDPQNLIKFYSSLFGWSFTKWSGTAEYWLVETGPSDQPGINGGLLRRPTQPPKVDNQIITAFVCTVDVVSLDDHLRRSESLGAVVACPKCLCKVSGGSRTSRTQMAMFLA